MFSKSFNPIFSAMELAGYDLAAGPWSRCAIVPLTLFWQAQAPPGADYNVFVHLMDENGWIVAQTDSAPAGGLRPTSGWLRFLRR